MALTEVVRPYPRHVVTGERAGPAPYLIEVSGVPATLISGALLAFGIASLVGSKAGGFLTDRRGVLPTLLGGMGLHLAALVTLSVVSGSTTIVVAVLVIWSVAAWSTGPT